MRNRILAVVCVALTVAISATATPAAGKGKPATPEPTVAVGNWLVLGPVPVPLPAFAGDARGTFTTGDLHKESLLPNLDSMPAVGSTVPWLGDAEAQWRQAAAGADATLRLVPAAGGGPQVAWLAVQVHAPSWQSVRAELLGTRLRRLLVDGVQLVSGGDKAGGGEVTGTLKLAPGTHLLVAQTVFDPATPGEWRVGLKLAAPVIPRVAFSTGRERTLDILDILDRPTISAVALSFDGRLVAVTMRRILPGTDDTESWVEIRDTERGELQRTWRGTGIKNVAWAKPGALSYVTSEKKKGKDGKDTEVSTLWLASLETGLVEPVLDRIENLGGYRWAGDGTTVVYSTTTRSEPDSRGIKLVESIMDRQRGHRDLSHLWLARHPQGVRVRITAGELSTRVEDHSADGRHLLFSRHVEDLQARPYIRTELWEMDLGTLATTHLRDFRWLDDAAYGPGGRLLVVGGPSAFGPTGVNLPAGVLPNEGDGQLFLWEPKTDTVEALSREFDPAISRAEWSATARAVIVTAMAGDGAGVFRLDLDARRFTRLDAGSAMLSTVSLAARAPVLAATGSSPWLPERLAVVDLATGATRVVLDPAQDWLPDTRQGQVQAWSCTVESGVVVDGRVYLPPGFDPARKYPAIVNYYAGTTPLNRAFGGRYPKEWWASLGYVVYVPQPSGATGYGQAHSARHVNEWGSLVVDEIIDATRQFLAAHPFVDPQRVGCIGASYGGFTTMAVVTRTDLFAAAVSHAGISSISSYWGEGYWGYTYNARSAAESFPWNRQDLYVSQSPLFAADKVKTPILLTHGTADTNVPVGESDSFFTALRLLGAPVEYLQVEGLDHLILDHAKRIVWSRAIVAWFDRHLKGEAGWWEDLAKAPAKEKK